MPELASTTLPASTTPSDSESAQTDDVVARLVSEGVIGMHLAAKVIGTFRDGKATHPTTLTRWAMRGVKLTDGRIVKLESFRLNGRLCTSKAAIIRFIQNQQVTPTYQRPQPTPAARNRAAEAATAELDTALGTKSKKKATA